MCRLLCGLVAVCVLQCAQSFILIDGTTDTCPTTCKCYDTMITCTANTLQAWPVDFQDAHKLERLDLHDNPGIGNLPSGAFNSFQQSITYLFLQNTGLTQVPPDMKHLQSLRELDMSHNAIGDSGFQDDAFGNGSMVIDFLTLKNMSLTRIPQALCSLTKIIPLNLDDNDITVINNHHAQCIRNITTLSLRNNGMRGIQTAFSLLTKLTFLFLDGNPFLALGPTTLSPLTNLHYLTLKNNSISRIDPEAFNYTTSLRFLFLNGNHLTEVPEALRLLNKHETIYLSDNPIQCTCAMGWASDWMKTSSPYITGNCQNQQGVKIDSYIWDTLSHCPA